MTRIFFVCGSNTCRSPMAEFFLKDLVKKAGLETQFRIASAAAAPDAGMETFSPAAQRILAEHGVRCARKSIRRMQRKDYSTFDLLIGMDWANLSHMRRICGGDPKDKMRLLLDFTGRPGEIGDPAFSGDYENTWKDIQAGCLGLLDALTNPEQPPRQAWRVVCFGDSNAYGYDPRSLFGERYEDYIRWTALLRRKGWQIFNKGTNGRAIPRLTGEIETACQWILSQPADVVAVTLGTNDLLQHPGLTAKICTSWMETFLSVLLDRLPSTESLLLTAPPAMVPGAWVEDAGILEESRRLPECYRELARKLGVGFADASGWGVALTFDGVHFSKSGHRTFAAGMHEALRGLLEQTETPWLLSMGENASIAVSV